MPRLVCLMLGASILLTGCNAPPSASPASSDEAKLQRVFKDFQQAFEDRKAERMWTLLDSSTQAAAERAAEQHRAAYAKESGAEKTAREKKLGLAGDAIATLTGASYLNAKPFRTKYHDVPEYKIAKFAVTGEKATIDLLADDGDKDTFELVRHGDAWKLVLAIPAE